jgi:hypothetical protein
MRSVGSVAFLSFFLSFFYRLIFIFMVASGRLCVGSVPVFVFRQDRERASEIEDRGEEVTEMGRVSRVESVTKD